MIEKLPLCIRASNSEMENRINKEIYNLERKINEIIDYFHRDGVPDFDEVPELKLELGKVYEDKDGDRYLIIDNNLYFTAINLNDKTEWGHFVENGENAYYGINSGPLLIKLSSDQRPYRVEK